MPRITISCASQASSCVGYLWQSASWCRTGRAFLAPESRYFCQFRLVCPKTWSETPEPGGTGHKAGPEKSEEQIQPSSCSCCQEVFEKHHKPESRSYYKLILYLLSGKKNLKIVLTYFCLTICLRFSAPSTLMLKTLLKSSKPAD